LEDCAEICELNADFLSRDSVLRRETSALCAKVCAEVAAECDRAQDGQIRALADACRSCVDSCHEMAEATADETVNA